jgi:hypothetical protein
MEWQPIETAPKDGTRIVLGNADTTWMAEYRPAWHRPANPWFSVMLNMDHLPYEKRYGAPTHWLVPAPPSNA